MNLPTEAAQIRIYVIESQGLLAQALCGIFSEDLGVTLVGCAGTFEEASLAGTSPDIIMLDVDHDLSLMRDAISECRKKAPNARVCVLSNHLSTEVMTAAIAAGADAYLVKDMKPENVMAAIRTVAREGFYADLRLAGALLRRNACRTTRDITELSPRETQVVRLIAQGLSNKEISERLAISDKTIKNHVSSIFSKLHVNARTQVAIHAIKTGLV